MSDFACQVIQSWKEFNSCVREMTSSESSEIRRWLYRGQPQDWELRTTIERALLRWDISLKDATSIEFQTIREFRRRLRQPEYDRVQEDPLHCLALMQHHSAPTRLLDCTYSPFVAAAFAMEQGWVCTKPVIWCFRARWFEEELRTIIEPRKLQLLDRRHDDRQRTDETFVPLYQLE